MSFMFSIGNASLMASKLPVSGVTEINAGRKASNRRYAYLVILVYNSVIVLADPEQMVFK